MQVCQKARKKPDLRRIAESKQDCPDGYETNGEQHPREGALTPKPDHVGQPEHNQRHVRQHHQPIQYESEKHVQPIVKELLEDV